LRAQMRKDTGYLDEISYSLDEALSKVNEWASKGEAKSIALIGNAADLLPKLVERKDFKPALATDQTSAHDPLYGYVPLGYTIEEVELARKEQPKKVRLDAEKSIAQHWEAMLKLHARGIPCFDYGNNIRAVAESQGVDEAFSIKGFVPLYIRPLFEEGKGPFRFACLSGDSKDLELADKALKELFKSEENVQRWLALAPQKVRSQGLPSRILWLAYG